jgi:hypothetical protein
MRADTKGGGSVSNEKSNAGVLQGGRRWLQADCPAGGHPWLLNGAETCRYYVFYRKSFFEEQLSEI